MKTAKWESIQPRSLRFRGHYKIYLSFALVFSSMLVSYWGYRFTLTEFNKILSEQWAELLFSSVFFSGFGAYYFLWLRPRLRRFIQVFPDKVVLHDGSQSVEANFEDVESVSMVYWSLFYFKMKDGHKHYFSSGFDRIDYVWEGLKATRPELMKGEEFEEFRLKLVQYDHHQKRKEWFFKHKVVDVFNWFMLPCLFLMCAYFVQSREVMIHQEGLYFFRLFMYSLLVLLVTNFAFSVVIKKFVFDKKLQNQMTAPEASQNEKYRDIEFEGVILQRSKIFQVLSACFIFAIIIKTDLNFYSVTKIKDDLKNYSLMKGKTVVVDNRYNCTGCRYNIVDGDIVIFGKGYVGQVMARSGEMVGEVSNDPSGRNIASSNIHTVPEGHVAIKSNNGSDLMFVKISDLMGKIQK